MPRRIPTNRTYTPRHEPARHDSGFYRRAAWRKLRRLYLQQHPICECEDRCGRPAEEVHHRMPRAERPDLELDPMNLQALTRQCHSRLTAQHTIRKQNQFGMIHDTSPNKMN